MKILLHVLTVFCILIFADFLQGQTTTTTVVFEQPGFPTLDTSSAFSQTLHTALPQAQFVSASELSLSLQKSSVTLLVMPYGSAFPLAQWDSIHSFLLRGGNLLTLGGKPFTRPVYEQQHKWYPLAETYVFARQLLISDYQKTEETHFTTPSIATLDAPLTLHNLIWDQSYSMVVRLSQAETSSRAGASGTPDAVLRPLLWGIAQGRRISAPVVEIDHTAQDYAGSRWIMMNCYIATKFITHSDAATLFASLARRAANGAEQLRVTPNYALYLPNEAWQLRLEWIRFHAYPDVAKAHIIVTQNGKIELERTVDLNLSIHPVDQIIDLPTNHQSGLHLVDIQIEYNAQRSVIYHTGFWVRDQNLLESGPRVSVDRNFFMINGQKTEIVGTTYMASDAQRLYFRYPNPAIWDRDMAEISAAGINMLRTGFWTDWDKVTENSSQFSEQSKRTLEAFLMTARRHNLPVQFTLFAFMPEVFGGQNPYLDSKGLERQCQYVSSVVKPFANVPFLMWDLINEPSFDNPKRFFATHANNDPIESAAWNHWLLQRYGSRVALEQLWQTQLSNGSIAPISDNDNTAQSVNDGGRPLAIYDFNLFAQQSFATWAQRMHDAVRSAGSKQLITVGQDEGGALTSPSPAFFRTSVDFTTMHNWWMNDDLLWDSLAVRQPQMPMLVQETGVMTEVNADGRPRHSVFEEGALFERKLGIALSTGAGAIEWLWNINAQMRSQQEVTIGAVRPDGTEKPEAEVLRAYATFAAILHKHLSDPLPAPIAIIASQAEQFSFLSPLAIAAQRRAVRVFEYSCHTDVRIVPENRIEEIKGSHLVVLPSVQMLEDSSWKELLRYVRTGGNLLITGPVERDEHWQLRDRLAALQISANIKSVDFHEMMIQVGNQKLSVTFPANIQQTVETLHFGNKSTYSEITLGAGHLFLVAAPIELAESPKTTEAIYKFVLKRLHIEPLFETSALPSSVLIRATCFQDAILYLFASEFSQSQQVNLHDYTSNARLQFMLPALRTRMILIDRKTKQILATYMGPA